MFRICTIYQRFRPSYKYYEQFVIFSVKCETKIGVFHQIIRHYTCLENVFWSNSLDSPRHWWLSPLLVIDSLKVFCCFQENGRGCDYNKRRAASYGRRRQKTVCRRSTTGRYPGLLLYLILLTEMSRIGN